MDVGFVWDETKYQKVLADHRVRFYEVVASLDDFQGLEFPDPAGHEDRWLWVGKTPWERLLVVIYSEQDFPVYRIITAFDAKGRWIDEYDRRERV